jgi:DNA-binding LacI/PurR family transcriptional regulator
VSVTDDTSNSRPARRRTAVMADVARLAGVSHQTVSRVLNGSTQVRATTRERVLLAMRQLDYRPNSAARALVTGRARARG